MALQDLTPQLRTRLGRMERAVGIFVGLAAVLLLSGFFYYLYHTAVRKGWFLTKVTYFTFVDNATGLKVGDPVKLMGFDAGEITKILAGGPRSATDHGAARQDRERSGPGVTQYSQHDATIDSGADPQPASRVEFERVDRGPSSGRHEPPGDHRATARVQRFARSLAL